jgi:hypothetical protein
MEKKETEVGIYKDQHTLRSTGRTRTRARGSGL